jgi:hypothetical protein
MGAGCARGVLRRRQHNLLTMLEAIRADLDHPNSRPICSPRRRIMSLLNGTRVRKLGYCKTNSPALVVPG